MRFVLFLAISEIASCNAFDSSSSIKLNKLPEIDIDQYMKNFNENDVDDVDNIFNDDNIFPSIPL